MENAAKAIMIAGAALLAVLLLTLFIYATRSMGESAANIYSAMDEAQISEFNQQFLNYNNRTDLKPQEVVTIINLAKESNANGKLEMNTIIVRLVPTKPEFDDFSNKKKADSNYDVLSWWIQDKKVEEVVNLTEDVLNDQKYSCKVYIDTTTKLVSSVNLLKNT